MDYLTQTVARVVADRAVSREELHELRKAIESVLPPQVRKMAVKRRREGKQAEFERALVESGVVLLTARDGQKYPIHSLINAGVFQRKFA